MPAVRWAVRTAWTNKSVVVANNINNKPGEHDSHNQNRCCLTWYRYHKGGNGSSEQGFKTPSWPSPHSLFPWHQYAYLSSSAMSKYCFSQNWKCAHKIGEVKALSVDTNWAKGLVLTLKGLVPNCNNGWLSDLAKTCKTELNILPCRRRVSAWLDGFSFALGQFVSKKRVVDRCLWIHPFCPYLLWRKQPWGIFDQFYGNAEDFCS